MFNHLSPPFTTTLYAAVALGELETLNRSPIDRVSRLVLDQNTLFDHRLYEALDGMLAFFIQPTAFIDLEPESFG